MTVLTGEGSDQLKFHIYAAYLPNKNVNLKFFGINMTFLLCIETILGHIKKLSILTKNGGFH